MELYGLEDAADWRHRRLMGSLAIGIGILARQWGKQEISFEEHLAEAMGTFVPEEG